MVGWNQLIYWKFPTEVFSWSAIILMFLISHNNLNRERVSNESDNNNRYDNIVGTACALCKHNTTACRIIVVSGTHRKRCFVPAADGGYANASQVPGEHSIAAAADLQRLRQS